MRRWRLAAYTLLLRCELLAFIHRDKSHSRYFSGGGGNFSRIFCTASFIFCSRFWGVFSVPTSDFAEPRQIRFIDTGSTKSTMRVPSSYWYTSNPPPYSEYPESYHVVIAAWQKCSPSPLSIDRECIRRENVRLYGQLRPIRSTWARFFVGGCG